MVKKKYFMYNRHGFYQPWGPDGPQVTGWVLNCFLHWHSLVVAFTKWPAWQLSHVSNVTFAFNLRLQLVHEAEHSVQYTTYIESKKIQIKIIITLFKITNTNCFKTTGLIGKTWLPVPLFHTNHWPRNY